MVRHQHRVTRTHKSTLVNKYLRRTELQIKEIRKICGVFFVLFIEI